MSALRITWSDGATATVVSAQGIQVVVHSSKPYPPGAPVNGVLHANDGDRPLTLKSTGSRKLADATTPTWEVKGRLLSAPVDLVAAFRSGDGPA